MTKTNEFECSVEETLNRLRWAEGKRNLGVTPGDFRRLKATAPPWPKGRMAFRSLDIRTGWEGGEGVALTFEHHVALGKETFGKMVRHHFLNTGKGVLEGKPFSPLLSTRPHRSMKDRIGAALFGAVYRPSVRWVTFDLGAYRERRCSVGEVVAADGENLLGPELLALLWLFPEFMQRVDGVEVPGFVTGGYRYSLPGYDSGRYDYYPFIGYNSNLAAGPIGPVLQLCHKGEESRLVSIPRFIT